MGNRHLAAWLVLLLGGCQRSETSVRSSYYERKIAPIVESNCARSATGSGCHVTADDRGNALGNLDASSFRMLSKRRDLLAEYGPYGMPQLLVKAVPPYQASLTAWDGKPEIVTIDVGHVGGSPIELTAPSFTVLDAWLDRGATENNAPRATTAGAPRASCSRRLGTDPSAFITEDAYGRLYVRRRMLGIVPLLPDGSARLQVPGGLPLVFGIQAALAGEPGVAAHHQREESQYYPGEWVTLSFRRELFDGFCGGCHGSVSGLETDVSVNPDILSSASSVEAKRTEANVLLGPAANGGQAPPFP